ncbi:MAG: hypothetical protein ACI86H_002184 [bacterium]|jgi:hypothetical protein
MKPTIRESLQDHYQDFHLSGEQFSKLEAMEIKSQNSLTRQQWSFKKIFLALPVVAMFIFIFIFIAWGVIPFQSKTFENKIIEEIAYNHNKRLASEIKTASFSQIKSYLTKLDFNMVAASALKTGWKLVGGRYCSINKKLAAQLHLKDSTTNQIYTWYQVGVPEKLKHQAKIIEGYSQGIKVRLWVENGILHGLAGL